MIMMAQSFTLSHSGKVTEIEKEINWGPALISNTDLNGFQTALLRHQLLYYSELVQSSELSVQY